MAQQAATLLNDSFKASSKEALIRELEEGERSGLIVNFNRDTLLLELRSKLQSASVVKTTALMEKRKAEFIGA